MKPLLEVRGMTKYYLTKKGFWGKRAKVRAVDGLNLAVYEGETLSLVGESGSGKSTTGRCILRLEEPTSGQIYYRGQDICRLNHREMRSMRRDIQMIFQDPFSSLNPRRTVGQILTDPLIVHGIGTESERRRQVAEIMDIVSLSKHHIHRYPHEFSGGQRQRIGIARALILRPRLIVADEPLSALDVSIQAQIVNLMLDLQKEFKLTYIFISHDLNVVRHISDRIAVMYLGKVVEVADKRALYRTPRHPYTQALLSAIPVPDPDHVHDRILLQGDLPGSTQPLKGCGFHPRCPSCMAICRTVEPVFAEKEPGHFTSCHL